MSEYKDYYAIQLREAHEYQDFVSDELYKIGLPICNYTSQKYQYTVGENKLGIEIKHDKKFAETGNLWIEVEEKRHPDNPQYATSGIMRDDNTWLYVIGDYSTIYIFSKVLLGQLYRTGKYATIENNTKTSRGFLFSAYDADWYAAKKIICQSALNQT